MSNMTETSIITCTCNVCQGRQARVKGDGTTCGGKPMTRKMRHNLVCLAYSPFAKAASTVKFGPWPVQITCEWYALCSNDSVGTVRHPILGDVPVCQRCADKHDMAVSK